MILSALLPAASFAEQQAAPPAGSPPSAPAALPAAGAAPRGGPKTTLDGAHGTGLKQKPLPGTNGAQTQPVPPAAGTPLQRGPISGGTGAQKSPLPTGIPAKGAWPGGSPADHNPKSDSTTSENSAEAGVASSMRSHPLPGYSHGHGAALSKKMSPKPAPGDYTKKNQHHPAEKVGEGHGEKQKPQPRENHASVSGESMKEQESKLHRMANPQESATELHSTNQQLTPASHALAGNSAARGQALIPAPAHHSPNPAIIGGGIITSRTRGTAAIGGASVAGSH